MDRLINANQLWRDILGATPDDWIDLDVLCELIDNASTEVRTGEWVVDTEWASDVMSGGEMVLCSECGKGVLHRSNYCPNCGSRNT